MRGSGEAYFALNGSYLKVSTVAPFLRDCSGLLPIPGHVIGVSWRRRRGSGVRRFSAKETRPIVMTLETKFKVIKYVVLYGIYCKCAYLQCPPPPPLPSITHANSVLYYRKHILMHTCFNCRLQ